ncbi:hypothetical protein [Caballeronia mineralivorans]|uniref:hypothetical protein n=1 Tax=Caballeronia mineralivorans TaxID=2010198 RepID=UPI00136488EE|nr:hypothetical protein [Caballeronia mineralivorans]
MERASGVRENKKGHASNPLGASAFELRQTRETIRLQHAKPKPRSDPVHDPSVLGT